jgi:hypothetical protein
MGGRRGTDPQVDPWCYHDSGSPPLACDEQARLACYALGLVGVPAGVYKVHASSHDDRLDCLTMERRWCPACGACELLRMKEPSLQNFEGCCGVEDDGTSILYAIWPYGPKTRETDVTNNPPNDMAAAALSMLHVLGWTQWWTDESTYADCEEEEKPPLN